MPYENLCMNCMHEKGNSSQCSHCHFNNDSLQLPPYLPMRTIVGGHYLVGAVLDSNGDGTTYMGYDTNTATPVEIREFLPGTIIHRSEDDNMIIVKPGYYEDYTAMQTSFQDLWRRLSKMSGLSALVSVEEVIEDNNTTYAIIEHAEGKQSLRDYLLASKDGYLSWKSARSLFMPVLSTLTTLHEAGIIHRGISPTNLYVYPDGKMKLSGFSIKECRTVNGGLDTEVYPGYSPIEQLGFKASAGPWTDIYSFAAVLYRALIGKAPIDAMMRFQHDDMMIPAKFAETLPNYVVNAMVNALQVLPEDRTRDIESFRRELSSSTVSELASEYEKEEKQRRRNSAYAAGAAGAAGAAAVGVAGAAATAKSASGSGKSSLDDTQVIPVGATYRDSSQYEAPRYESSRYESPRYVSSRTPKGEMYDNYDDKNDYEDEYDSESTKKASKIIITAVITILVIALISVGIYLAVNSIGGSSDDETTSESVEAVDVPDFVGKNFTTISNNSDYTSDFRIVEKEVYSDTVTAGYVISQSIDAGTKVASGTEITLTVSKGVHYEAIPDVTDATYEDAKAQLEALGFTVNRVDRTNFLGMHTDETVASVSPSSGSKTYPVNSTTVTLYVWTSISSDTTTESTTESESTTEESTTDSFIPDLD